MMRRAARTVGHAAGILALGCVSACGDTTATPIVALDPGPGLSTDPPPPPTDDGQLATGPVFGLCDVCDDNDACGDGNDHCLRYRDDPERFCGRDCQEGRGCPAGYDCVGLANSSASQCVPEARTCEHRRALEAPPRLAELRVAALEQLNLERQRLALPLLAADDCLDEIAQTSSREHALNGQRGTKYARECAPELPNCACGWATEFQVTVAEYGLVWSRAMTLALDLGLATSGGAEPPLTTMSSTRVGIGVLLGGDESWISFALGD